MNVQAYILNISAIQTIEELKERAENDYLHDIDAALSYGKNEVSYWTAPSWIISGDIIFFYHAATANTHNKRLRKEVRNGDFEDAGLLNEYLDYCDELYDKYGGKVFAVGKIGGSPGYSETDFEHSHFKSRIFAPVIDIVPLQFPVSRKQFEDFMPITRQQSITFVLGNDFMKLKSIILRYNEVPYLEKYTSVSVPLRDISSGNWLKSANENGRRYLYEAQFRKYYADYMLMCLADNSKIYSEVNCVKDSRISGRADNCMLFCGKYLFIEIKRNMFTEEDIINQIQQYCMVDSVKILHKTIKSTEIYQHHVLVIDEQRICLYDTKKKDELMQIAEFDNVKSMSDIRKIKDDIKRYVNGI